MRKKRIFQGLLLFVALLFASGSLLAQGDAGKNARPVSPNGVSAAERDALEHGIPPVNSSNVITQAPNFTIESGAAEAESSGSKERYLGVAPGGMSQAEEEEMFFVGEYLHRIKAVDLLNVSEISREKILKRKDQFEISKGIIDTNELKGMSGPNQHFVQAHPELFDIK